MPSNGLSRRRRVLKRPLVCKSKPTGDCGACSFDVELIPQNGPGGSQFIAHCLLTCDPNPSHDGFALSAQGGAAPNPPTAGLTPNIAFDWQFTAPAGIASYLITIYAINQDRCIFKAEEFFDVTS